MPADPVDPYAADSAPRVRPLSYPGRRPPTSTLISDTAMWEITDRHGERLAWTSAHLQRLPNCRVALYPDETARLGLSVAARPHLSSVLDEHFSVGPDARVPVLAIGSNAAPSQLRHKFRMTSTTLLIPSIRARLQDVRVGFCSFVSSLGYVPATLVPESGAETEVAVQLLDDQQLAAVDETERSAYRRVWLDAPVRLDTGETLPGAYAYVARHGYLGSPGAPWVMGASGEERPADVDEDRWFATQTALLERLASVPSVAEVLGAEPAEMVARRIDPWASTRCLVEAGLVVPDNPLHDLDDEIGRPSRRYGALITPGIVRSADGQVTAVTGRSHDFLERQGRSVVRLGTELDRLLGAPDHVELVSTALRADQHRRAPTAIATVLRGNHTELPPPPAVEVDHVLRMALGVEAGEYLTLRRVEVRRASWPDAVLGFPNSVTMRVTLADPSTTERDVCLMSQLSLSLLGVSSGDYVVLEGAADDRGRVPTLSVKAFELPGDILDERVRVSSGVWGARFPGVRETLGVAPDIPIIFLDASSRARLGIADQQLATVRARPARLQQFGSELREMMLLLAVALIGLLSILPSPVLAVVCFVALLVATVALTMVKLRRRLSHPRGSS